MAGGNDAQPAGDLHHNQGKTLLGHLAFNFTRHPENLATEALAFVLERSLEARRAMARLLGDCGIEVPEGLCYRSQAGSEDRSIPDLVGVDGEGRRPVIIEAKFWAGLTDNQPCGYLKQLPEGVPAILLFVAPVLRADSLWGELMQHVPERLQQDADKPMEELRLVRANAEHRLGMISWRALLALLVSHLEAANEHETASDLRQLQGLCDRMDTNAFLPIRPEEFAPEIPRRIKHLCEIVDAVAQRGVDTGFASSKDAAGKNFKPAITATYYGRSLMFGDVKVCFQLHFDWWAQIYPTPLWLEVFGRDSGNPQGVRDLLRKYGLRLLISDQGTPIIPLELPLGVERNAVVNRLVNQLKEIAQKLNPTSY